MPSLRQSRQTASWYRPMSPPLHPPPLGRPASIVRNGRDILDEVDFQPGRLERADRGLAPGARSLDVDLDLAHALLHRLARGVLRREARGERRPLAGPLEPRRPRARPRQDVALEVADRHDRIVERGLDVGNARRHVPLFLALAACPCAMLALLYPALLALTADRRPPPLG